MRTRLWTLAVLAAVLLLPSPTTAGRAQPPDGAARELAEAEAILENASDEAKTAGRALIEAQQRLPQMKKEVNKARGVVAAAQVKASAAAEDAEASRDAHGEAKAQYKSAREDVIAVRTVLSDIASDFYQRDGVATIAALLRAEDAGNAADRMDWAREMMRGKQEALDEVLAVAEDARDAKHKAQTARQTAESAEAAASEALRQAESDFALAEQAQTELEELLDAQAAAQQQAESHKDATLARYEDANQASEQIAGQLRGTSAQGDGTTDGFLMPVNGWKSSDYGMRFDPVYQVEQLHAGVDFAAGRGEPIRAVADGEVAEAGWNGGYGNYTCVHHGDDISTCYGHQSKILVSRGDQVARGDTIGEVGTTGASTGDHLHFEVRRNGDPVEPLEWLPKCLC